MATRSTIAKENADGTITSVYCHWDGYPEGVGQTLADHYTDPAYYYDVNVGSWNKPYTLTK